MEARDRIRTLYPVSDMAGPCDQSNAAWRTGKCVHVLSGLLSYGMCSYGYNCARCSIDHMIEEASRLPAPEQIVFERASGF